MINKLITNYNTGIRHTIIDKPENIQELCNGYYKFSIYNRNIDHPLQKYWFYIDKVKIIHKHDNDVRLVLSNSVNDNNLIKYISDLENDMEKHVGKDTGKTRSVKRTFLPFDDTDLNTVSTIKIKFNSLVPVFDETGKNITVEQIKCDNCISMYLELNDVVVSKTEIWFSWKILQIKLLNDIDFTQTFFNNTENIKTSIPVAPGSPIRHLETTNRVKNSNDNSPPKLYISQGDIVAQLNKLNKTKKATVDVPITVAEPVIEVPKITTKSNNTINKSHRDVMNELNKTLKRR